MNQPRETQPDRSWFARAECAGLDPDLFVTRQGHNGGPAREVCAQCRVRDECLEWAIAHHEAGVWGGTSDKQRQQIRRQRKAAA